MKKLFSVISLLLALSLLLSGCSLLNGLLGGEPDENPTVAYEELNGNVPYFTDSEITDEAYEFYSELDALGRCGVVMACVGRETMPPKGDKRGDINGVYPSGWEQAKYDAKLVKGGYLYNRSHLIGWQLTDEDANEKNLITGTRFFNVSGMLPFEDLVDDYVRETGNHVMYRVTPDFKGNNLVATGVTMEALSVEDNGDGVCFCVYVYNFQPGIIINYATGESRLDDGEVVFPPSSDTGTEEGDGGEGEPTPTYVANSSSSSMKFHSPSCGNAQKIGENNRVYYYGTREEVIADGYSPAGCCNP